MSDKWKLVPVHPTSEMLDALYQTAQIHKEWGVDPYVENDLDVWREMINAAPPATNESDLVAALQEVLKTPGLQSGLQAMCAAAVSKALGVPIDEVFRDISATKTGDRNER